MASGAAASSVLSTMAKLQESRASTGDFTITCQGTEIKAHSYVLANGSDYFKNLLASDFDEGIKKSVDIKDCESTTLATTIAFLYGVEVPPRFADSRGLLKMADMFFMEELREEAGRRLARVICERNFLELTVLAETHRSAALTAAAAKFIVNREGEVDVGVLEGLPRVTAAVAEAAMQVVGQARKEASKKKRKDFGSFVDYADCIRANAKEGMRIKANGTRGTIIVSQGRILKFKTDDGSEDEVYVNDYNSHTVELIETPDHLLAK